MTVHNWSTGEKDKFTVFWDKQNEERILFNWAYM